MRSNGDGQHSSILIVQMHQIHVKMSSTVKDQWFHKLPITTHVSLTRLKELCYTSTFWSS